RSHSCFSSVPPRRPPHSFPTRRSSDLASGTQTGPVNYELAKQLATSQLPASHPASSIDVAKVVEAVKLAEVWLDGATSMPAGARDRKSTRLNSSHVKISYAVFCLKKKN